VDENRAGTGLHAPPAEDGSDLRIDVHTGLQTHVVGSRQDRPNLPSTTCPFCPGGLEAPEPYEVRWFVNRWPPMPDARCEVVLYAPEHDATFWSLGARRARKVVDLWADRSAALGARPDVAYVLVFENRGASVGATISHPHGQIYAFDSVPDLPRRELERRDAFGDPGDRLVAAAPAWRAWVPYAPTFPYALLLVPDEPAPDLPSLDDAGRNGLALLLVDVLERLDRLFDAATPYMLWIHQRPFDGGDWPHARLHVEIVSPWRAPGVPRYIAAGELGSGVYFNPVQPEAAAEALRDALP
jgi:UDPglucose--hexose-1-phosphate uridylyltransferase